MYLICESIEMNGFKDPNETGCVRGSLVYLVFHIEKLNEKKSKVTYFTETDPGGWMPSWIVNQMTETQAYHPLRLKKYLESKK
jgi:hypothetical protein